jgi:hypothetical protein
MVALAFLGCEVNERQPPVEVTDPTWGEPGYSITPLIAHTPSVAEIEDARSDIVTISELSKDKSYYIVRVGVNTPDRFDPWFTLKVTKEGKVFRERTNPDTLELEWVLDRTVEDAAVRHRK